jgi:hypothetical protein
MCAYTRKIESTNISKIFDQQCPDPSDLRELNIKDGLIWQFKQMNKNERIGNNNDPAPKIKVLMCVCMYNESRNAINLTLEGIY